MADNALQLFSGFSDTLTGLAPAFIEMMLREQMRQDPIRQGEIARQMLDAQNFRQGRQQRSDDVTDLFNQSSANLASMAGNPALQFNPRESQQFEVFEPRTAEEIQAQVERASSSGGFDVNAIGDFARLLGDVGGGIFGGGGGGGGQQAPAPAQAPANSGVSGISAARGAGSNPFAAGAPANQFDFASLLNMFQPQQPAQAQAPASPNSQKSSGQAPQGTPNVPGEMTVTLHPGEMVVPAHLNPFAGMTPDLQTFQGGPPPVGPDGAPALQDGTLNVPDPAKANSPGVIVGPQIDAPGRTGPATAVPLAPQVGPNVIAPSRTNPQPQAPQGLDRFGPMNQASMDAFNQFAATGGQPIGQQFQGAGGPIQGNARLNTMAGVGVNPSMMGDITGQAGAQGGLMNQMAQSDFGFTPESMQAIMGSAGRGADLLNQITANATGFGTGTQDAIFNRGKERLDAETMALQRQLRDAGGAGGQVGAGGFQSNVMDLEQQRLQGLTGLQRDIGIEAAQRQHQNLLGSFGAQQSELARLFGQNIGAGQFETAVNQGNMQNLMGAAGLQSSDMGRQFNELLGAGQFEQGVGQANFQNMFNTVGQNAAIQGQQFNQNFAGNQANNALAQQNLMNQFAQADWLNNAFNQERGFNVDLSNQLFNQGMDVSRFGLESDLSTLFQENFPT